MFGAKETKQMLEEYLDKLHEGPIYLPVTYRKWFGDTYKGMTIIYTGTDQHD